MQPGPCQGVGVKDSWCIMRYYQRSGKTISIRSFTASYILGLLACVALQAGINRYVIAFMIVLTLGCQVLGYLSLALLREDTTVYDDTD